MNITYTGRSSPRSIPLTARKARNRAGCVFLCLFTVVLLITRDFRAILPAGKGGCFRAYGDAVDAAPDFPRFPLSSMDRSGRTLLLTDSPVAVGPLLNTRVIGGVLSGLLPVSDCVYSSSCPGTTSAGSPATG